jgi:hypothetical protein
MVALIDWHHMPAGSVQDWLECSLSVHLRLVYLEAASSSKRVITDKKNYKQDLFTLVLGDTYKKYRDTFV